MAANFRRFFLILSASIVGVLFLSFGSTYICNHYCQYAEGGKEYASALLVFCEFRAFIGGNIEVISAAFTAAATMAIGVYTALLFRISERTESGNRIIERAYIFTKVIRKDEFIYSFSGDAPNKVEVIFTNSGKTPGVIRKLRAYPLLSETPPHELIAHKAAENEITAGLSISKDAPFIEMVKVNISATDWGEIERLEKTLYILGKIEYDDVFTIRRETGFCWQYTVGGGREGFVISPIPKLNYYT